MARPLVHEAFEPFDKAEMNVDGSRTKACDFGMEQGMNTDQLHPRKASNLAGSEHYDD